MKKRYGVGWAVLIGLPLLVELWTIFNTAAGDTLSESVTPLLRAHPLIWFASLGLYAGLAAWLGWHWWFERKVLEEIARAGHQANPLWIAERARQALGEEE